MLKNTALVAVVVVVVVVFVAVVRFVRTEPNVYRDFCEKDTFRTKCSGDDEVAVIQHASYGRMKVGTCLVADYGSLGCSKNILPQLDQLCSGRATCTLNVRDLLNFNPCPEDLRGYLEVMYTCVKVHNPAHSAKDSSICLSNSRTSPTEVIANKTKDTATYLSHGLKNTFMYSGIISNYITEVTNCGGLDHPWSIRAQPGQRINITIMDFSGLEAGSGNDKSWKSSGLCQVFANIQDRTVGTTETLCADEPRVRHAYLSVSHHVEVRTMVRANKAEPAMYALLYYHVVGCPDVTEASFGHKRWFKKESSEKAVYGCLDTREVHELTCAVNEWRGSEVVNCSSGGFAFTSGFLSGKHLSVEDKIVLTVVVTCFIGLVVLIGGIFVVKRKMTNRLSHSDLRTSQDDILRHNQLVHQHQQQQQQHQQLQHQHQQQLIYAQKLQSYTTTTATPLTSIIKSPLQQTDHGLPQGYAFGHEAAVDCYFRRPLVQAAILPRLSVPSKPPVVTPQDDPLYNKLISDHIYESPKSVRKEVERLMENEREKVVLSQSGSA